MDEKDFGRDSDYIYDCISVFSSRQKNFSDCNINPCVFFRVNVHLIQNPTKVDRNFNSQRLSLYARSDCV